MALARCRECDHQVSSVAGACPHCGCKNPIPPPAERGAAQSAARIAIGVIASLVLLAMCARGPTPPPTPIPAPAAPAPKPTPPPTPAAIKARAAVDKITDDHFCLHLGRALRDKKSESNYRIALIERAKTREAITDRMLDAIIARRPALGMNPCAVIAALGKADRANRSVGRHGEHYQLVYSERRLYVYLDNSVVTSWQE